MDEIQYTLTRDDFWHLQLYAYSRRQRQTILLRLIIIIILLGGLFIVLDRFFSGDHSLSIFFFTIFCL